MKMSSTHTRILTHTESYTLIHTHAWDIGLRTSENTEITASQTGKSERKVAHGSQVLPV